MRDPQAILSQVRQGSAPSTWRVFTKERGIIGGFLSGTMNNPDPLLVFTPEGVIEYANEKKPPTFIAFADLSEIRLQVAAASSLLTDLYAHRVVWLDLYYLNGEKVKWQSSSFIDNLQVIQCFIETYSVYKVLERKE